MYYLDNAATTKPLPQILDQLRDLLEDSYGNPGSIHPAGIQAGRVIDNARKTLAGIFDVPLAGIIFCGSGTESDNLAIKGFFQKRQHQNSHLIISPLEHAAILKTSEWLAENKLARIDYAGVHAKTGQIDTEHLASLINDQTRMVSIQHVNSETGVIQDLAGISKTIKSINPEILIHSDGVQAFGRIPVNLDDLGVDLYSISAHKFHGIKGAGALIMKKEVGLTPVIHGGGQENGYHSGTENLAAIAAMGIAAERAIKDVKINYQKLTDFASNFKQVIREKLPECRILEGDKAVPHIISLSFPGIPGEVLLHHLAEQGIFVSTGSACNATSKKTSPVLRALGFSTQKIKETIRISLAASEIPENRERFFQEFLGGVKKLQGLV
jgi:cysteine desulfurase